MKSWPIHEAKARLSELVKRAQKQPQQLTSHGEPVAVVVSAEAYRRQQQEGESLVVFIRRSPLVGADELDRRPLPAVECLLEATALEHNLVLTTRNLKDLAALPVAVANPWTVEGESISV